MQLIWIINVMLNQWISYRLFGLYGFLQIRYRAPTGLPGHLTLRNHCGTFRHVSGHKLLNACTFFSLDTWTNQSYPKITYTGRVHLKVGDNFFPNPLPPKIAPKVLKSVFDIVMVWKKIVPSWNLMQVKILVNLTYFAGL